MSPNAPTNDDQSTARRPLQPVRRFGFFIQRSMKIALCIIACVVVVWLIGDFIYSRILAARANSWEETINRDEAGVRIGCREYSAGEGETLFLLVHGINESPAVYRKMTPEIVAAGNCVRATRLPGFGLPLAEYAQSDRSQWVEQIKSDVDELSQDHKRIVLVAHSLGAAVAIQYLLTEEEPQIDAAVFLAPAIEVSNIRSPLAGTRFWHEASQYALLFTRMTESPFDYDACDPEVRDNPFAAPFTPRTVINETFKLIDANRNQAEKIEIPVLIVLGEHDHVVDNQAAEAFFNQLGSDRKKLLILPEAAHAIPVDYGWKQATDEILAFVDE